MSWEIIHSDSQIIAIHAALIPVGSKGSIVYFSGDQHTPSELTAGHIDNCRVHDISTNTIATANGVTTDLFCCGHAFLSDGRLLVTGGTKTYEGGPDEELHHEHFRGERGTWIFAPHSNTWTRVADMNFEPGHSGTGGGRWYPSLITLADGRVFTTSGHPANDDSRHNNDTPEFYDPGSNTWNLPNGDLAESNFYPRVFLLPNGNIFFTTPIAGRCRFYNPNTFRFEGADVAPAGEGVYDGINSSAILLPLLPNDGYTARVMVSGGLQPRKISLDGPTPSWTDAGARNGAAVGRMRLDGFSTLLPTGQIFCCGGINPAPDGSKPDTNAVLEAEIYNPGIDWAAGTYSSTESWQTVEAATVARNYHSVAILLPDGRVWTGGSDHNGGRGLANRELRIEVFKPSYFGNASCPDLNSAPASAAYSEHFRVSCPQAANIRRVALIRAGSGTHAFNYDQRYVGLTFTRVEGTSDQLDVVAPPNSRIAPPGNYMLWLVDAAGLPCKLAKFIRITQQRCFIITDRSSFSSLEVEALLPMPPAAGIANFSKALYVVFDGFLPAELGSTPPPAPNLRFTFDSASGAVVGGMTYSFRDVKFEDSALNPDIAQRVTFIYDVSFSNTNAFSFATETRAVIVRATLGDRHCDAQLDLYKQPNPYMRDGDTSWLSIDVRTFQIKESDIRFGVTHGNSDTAPEAFLSDLLTRFNDTIHTPNDEFHPFNDISTDQQTSALELSRSVSGKRVFNYAIAKVRYRAVSMPATDVRLMFRLFRCVGTPFEYDTTGLYRRTTDGPTAVALNGRAGGELIAIPCFAKGRVTPGADMHSQLDPLNKHTINPSGSGTQESAAFFGCWLDFNQDIQHMPLNPTNDGPFTTGLKTIQELMRGDHCCLVAEVHFKPTAASPDLITAHATPGTSDKLSQRNLAVVRSGNPGSAGTRTIQHTFVVRSSVAGKALDANPFFGLAALPTNKRTAAKAVSNAQQRIVGPDELMLLRDTVPRGAIATIFLPDVKVDDVLALHAHRAGPNVFEKVDEHTLKFTLNDANFIPIPPGTKPVVPGLLSLELPPGVVKGQLFAMTAHQWSGVTRRVIGSFQITIPVEAEAKLLVGEERRLSVMKHINASIPASDHWKPIFDRYLGEIAKRVRGFGGNPDEVPASPDGIAPHDVKEPHHIKNQIHVGKVDRIVFGCFGDFEGFILESCDGEQVLKSSEPAIKELIQDAWINRWWLRITTEGKHHQICKIELAQDPKGKSC